MIRRMTLAELLANAKHVLVFTGAGISTGSGIPDYRGPQGVWKTKTPVMFQEFMASEEARVRHWRMKLENAEMFAGARPNAAHLALAELEKLGRLECLVTQNIDGLHHDAGNDPARVVEIHGTNRKVACMTCGALSDPAPALAAFKATERCPRCECGGFLKTATISFGQSMPQDLLERAFDAASRADLAIAIGSTLEVQPAASIPYHAYQSGADYCIINRGETAHDSVANVRLEGDAVELLPAIVRELVELLAPR